MKRRSEKYYEKKLIKKIGIETINEREVYQNDITMHYFAKEPKVRNTKNRLMILQRDKSLLMLTIQKITKIN